MSSKKRSSSIDENRPPKKRKIECPICGQSFPLIDIEAHADNCFFASPSDNSNGAINEKKESGKVVRDQPLDAPKKKPDAPVKKKPEIQSNAPNLMSKGVDSSEKKVQAEEAKQYYTFGTNDCMICMEEKCDIAIKLECGCSLCPSCFKYYADHSIKNTQIFKCTKCNFQVSSTLFRAAGVSKDQIEKYTKIEQIHLKQDQSLFRCLTTDCPEAVHMNADAFKEPLLPIQFFNQKSEQEMLKIPGVDPAMAKKLIRKVPYDSWESLRRQFKKIPQWVIANLMNDHDVAAANPEWTCTTCKHKWCVRCKVKWHANLTCAEAQMHNKFQEKADEGFLDMIRRGEIFRCKCGMFISKSGGCQYMDCSKCGQAFCWQCHSFLRMSHAPHSCSKAKRKENIAKMIANRNESGTFEKKNSSSAKNQGRRGGRNRRVQLFNIADYMPQWAIEAMGQEDYDDDDDDLAEIANDDDDVGCMVQ